MHASASGGSNGKEPRRRSHAISEVLKNPEEGTIMKRARLTFAAALLSVAGLYAAAQGPQNRPGMQGMGMMAGMHDPLDQSTMTVFLLPYMRQELGLSAQQANELNRLKQDLLTKAKEISTRIAEKQKELDTLLASNTAKPAQVKTLLEEIANLKAQRQFAGFETASKMKSALTEQQRNRLAALKPAELHQAMMAHMTMGDMMQMMELIGADGMMPGRMMGMMMGGEMMSRGMMSPPKK
jgi:cell division protein FtsB